jgi:glycosyltransferase involved in cell wall biosynthesis
LDSNRLPRVSVVMPAWNRADTILMAVESVLRQSFTDFELLVVDDGSTDGTMEALAEVTDPRLQRLTNPRNMGPSAARNTGIRAAQADWVAFQDSDDEWLPEKLGKQMAKLATAGPEVVACYTGMIIVGQADRQGMDGRTAVSYIPGPGEQSVEGRLHGALLARSFVSTQMFMARRSTLLDLGGFDESLPALEDWDCVIRLSKRGEFSFVDEPLVIQRFSQNSLTRSSLKRLQSRIIILRKNYKDLTTVPHILAKHHIAISGEQRRIGDLAAARSSLVDACRAQPMSAAVWSRMIWTIVLSLLSWCSCARER